MNQLNGILIPYYMWPGDPYTDTNVQRLLDCIRLHYDVPVMVILNPNNGPGTDFQWQYGLLMELLQAAGAKILGYVATGYASRPEEDVKHDIDRWLHLYQSPASIDGIFLDEMPYDPGVGLPNVYLYMNYTIYCHAAGLMTVANPGTNQQPVWFYWGDSADVIVVHEAASWPDEASMEGNYAQGHAWFSHHRRAALVYNQAGLNKTQLDMLRKYVQWVYVSNDNAPNPWDTLPSYLEDLFGELSAINPVTEADILDKAYKLGFCYVGGILGPSQLLGVHKFTRAISVLANFSRSTAGGTANATASTVISISRALAASPNTFNQIGTITFAPGTVTATFAAAPLTFQPGDVLRLTGPAAADSTFANFYCTLVGD